jgi:D-apiose dehydrogenase
MTELRFAVAGAGFWARYQLAAWGEVPGARCVAVCDRDRARAERLAAAHGAAAYADAAEMLDRERPDFLDVVTDLPGHAALVKLAAARRVPVVCQKPMAATLPECAELVETCRRAGVPFIVHENWRWQTPLRHVKELLAQGAVGTPFRCRIDTISGFDVFANQPYLKEQPAFIVADMGCHLFDLARSYFGEAECIDCQTARARPDIRGEDVATALLTMNGGRTAVVVNLAFAGTPLERECFPQTLVFIEGDRGSVEVAPDFVVRVTTAAGTHARRVPPPRYPWADPDYAVVHASMVPCHGDVLRALRTGAPAETDAADYLKSMRLVFAAYESARTGRAVRPSELAPP